MAGAMKFLKFVITIAILLAVSGNLKEVFDLLRKDPSSQYIQKGISFRELNRSLNE